MTTQIAPGSAQATKLYSVALFAETQRARSFKGNLTGSAPKQGSAESKLRNQTSADYPFVRITDLAKSAGDRVTVDLVNVIKGYPTMGDKKIAGRLMSLKLSTDEIEIDQTRGGVDTGGRMTQQRTPHQLRALAKQNLVGWNARLDDQLCLIHVAGARGYQDDDNWCVPLESHSEFGDIVVNAVEPPSPNRRMFAADGTSVTDLANTDALTLGDIDRIRAVIDEMEFPMQPIKLEGDPMAEDEPLYCMYVTSRQWHSLQTATGDQAWRTFLQNAWNRANSWTGGKKHPLYSGTPGMWNGILIKKTRYAVRFPAGSNVSEYASDGTTINTVQAAVDTDRAIVLGAQALGIAYGKHGGSGYHYNWHEELTDHGNVKEISTAMVGGKKKIKFTGSSGEVTDHGVLTMDTYAPAVS